VRDDSDDYTTKSFLFNLYINIGILVGSLIIFVFYRWFRGDLKTLGISHALYDSQFLFRR